MAEDQFPSTNMHTLIIELRAAAEIANRIYNKKLKPRGISVAEYVLLDRVARSPRHAIGIAQLAAEFGLREMSVRGTVKLLESRGWVVLRRRPGTRGRVVDITGMGRARLTAARGSFGEAERKVRRLAGSAMNADSLQELLARFLSAVDVARE